LPAYLVDEAANRLVIVVVIGPGRGVVQGDLRRTVGVDVFALELRQHQIGFLACERLDPSGNAQGQPVGVGVAGGHVAAPALGHALRIARRDARYRFAPAMGSRDDDRQDALADQHQVDGRRIGGIGAPSDRGHENHRQESRTARQH
jgi:hypothetical protein